MNKLIPASLAAFAVVGATAADAATDRTPPTISKLTVNGGYQCGPLVADCQPADTVIRFTLSEKSNVLLVFSGKSNKTIAVKGKAGRNAKKISPFRLGQGRYKLTISATDAAGNKSKSHTKTFRVDGFGN